MFALDFALYSFAKQPVRAIFHVQCNHFEYRAHMNMDLNEMKLLVELFIPLLENRSAR
jgi:hypothetical protein